MQFSHRGPIRHSPEMIVFSTAKSRPFSRMRPLPPKRNPFEIVFAWTKLVPNDTPIVSLILIPYSPTDAIARLVGAGGVKAYRFEGKRYDCGSKLGYLEATVELARDHPQLGDDFRRFLSALQKGGR